MENEDIIQLMHEGYHSIEAIAKMAGVTVSYVNNIYNEFLGKLTDEELVARGYPPRGIVTTGPASNFR